MNISAIQKVATSKIGQTMGAIGLKLSKHGPTIGLVAGIVSIGGGIFLACRATLKSVDVIQERKDNMDIINNMSNSPVSEYSEEERKHDIRITNARCFLDLAKLYLPAIAATGLGIGLIIASHKVLLARNAALAMAYEGIKDAFDKYRKRVIEDYGEEIDYNFRNGIHKEVITEKDENGKKVKKEVTRLSADDISDKDPYSRLFDEYNPNWKHDPQLNAVFLKHVQQYCNDQLYLKGHIFLNEVFDALGMDRSPAGAVTGWVSKKNGGVDGYVDFGIFNRSETEMSPQLKSFIYYEEPNVMLNFNVDGVIYDKI